MGSLAFANNSAEALGHSYVRAINKSSIKDIKSLIHPECPPSLINEKGLDRTSKKTIPSDYDIKVIDLTPDNQILKLKVPAVKSEKLMNIAYMDESGKRQNLIGFVTPKDGHWYLVECGKAP